MTRDELLKAAQDSIETGSKNHWYNDPAYSQTAFLHAIACILLAKEMTTTEVVNTLSARSVRIHTDEEEG